MQKDTKGLLLKGIGGFYYVHTHQGVYECRARGIFRKDKEKPLPGDLVSISVLDETEKKEIWMKSCREQTA